MNIYVQEKSHSRNTPPPDGIHLQHWHLLPENATGNETWDANTTSLIQILGVDGGDSNPAYGIAAASPSSAKYYLSIGLLCLAAVVLALALAPLLILVSQVSSLPRPVCRVLRGCRKGRVQKSCELYRGRPEERRVVGGGKKQ